MNPASGMVIVAIGVISMMRFVKTEGGYPMLWAVFSAACAIVAELRFPALGPLSTALGIFFSWLVFFVAKKLGFRY